MTQLFGTFWARILPTPSAKMAVALGLAVALGGATAPASAQGPGPSTSPPLTQTPTPPPVPEPRQPPPPAAAPADKPTTAKDAFGEDVTMTEKPIIYFAGQGLWDSAFDTIVDGFKSVYGYMEKQGIKAAGAPLTIYTQTDDTGFSFQAAVPVETAPADIPKGDIAAGKSPAGKALKFTHRGSYDAMDSTYEAITNFLDEKRLEAKDLFVEEYVTDPVKTPEDDLVITVYVPVK